MVVFCLTLECVARLDSFFTKRDSFLLIQVRDKNGFKGKPYAKWRGIRLNKYGFNDADDYYLNKKTHRLRVMCLGDSATFDISNYPDNWPNLLGKLLKSKGIDAEVINAAMPGNTYPDLIRLFENEYIKFKPDILIIYKEFRSYMALPAPRISIYKRALRKSLFIEKFLYRAPKDDYTKLLNRRKSRDIENNETGISKDGLFRYKNDLEHLAQICKNNNIKLVLAPVLTLVNKSNLEKYKKHVYRTLYYYPTIDENAFIDGMHKFNNITYEVAQKEDILYIDISKGIELNEEFFLDNFHLAIKGIRKVAQNYCEGLSEYIAHN